MAADQAIDIIDESYALGSLGSTQRHFGDLEAAERTLLRRIGLSDRIGDLRGLRNSLGNLGNVYSDAGRYEEALEYHHESLSLSREMHDGGGQATDHLNIGDVYDTKEGNELGNPQFICYT